MMIFSRTIQFLHQVTPKKLKFKTFASIDLDKMQIPGTDEAWLLSADTPHFSQGAEMFYKENGSEIKFYSVKKQYQPVRTLASSPAVFYSTL